MGKTAFALNIAEYVAIDFGLPVAVFSMEMSGEQVAMRLLGSLARVSQHKIRTGRVEEDDWSRVTKGLERLQNAQHLHRRQRRAEPARAARPRAPALPELRQARA